jgi:transglutaminase-like putative cysteine protease
MNKIFLIFVLFLLIPISFAQIPEPVIPDSFLTQIRNEIISYFLRIFGLVTVQSKYLNCTFYVDCDNPKVISIANEIKINCSLGIPIADIKLDNCSSYNLAYYDMLWVSKNINFNLDYTYTWIKASDILERRAGVCAHMAIVYCAIARVQGFPCKVINGYNPYYPYIGHAWNEVYVNGKWILSDSTYRLWDEQAKIDLINKPCYKIANENTIDIFYCTSCIPYTCPFNYTYNPNNPL